MVDKGYARIAAMMATFFLIFGIVCGINNSLLIAIVIERWGPMTPNATLINWKNCKVRVEILMIESGTAFLFFSRYEILFQFFEDSILFSCFYIDYIVYPKIIYLYLFYIDFYCKILIMFMSTKRCANVPEYFSVYFYYFPELYDMRSLLIFMLNILFQNFLSWKSVLQIFSVVVA